MGEIVIVGLGGLFACFFLAQGLLQIHTTCITGISKDLGRVGFMCAQKNVLPTP